MKKIFLILTTFVVFNAIASEIQVQPNAFKKAYDFTMPKIKASSGLFASGFGTVLGTILTTYSGFSTKHYGKKAFRLAENFSPDVHPLYEHASSLHFGIAMGHCLGTLTVGALTMWCLYYFGKNYKDLFYRYNPATSETDQQKV